MDPRIPSDLETTGTLPLSGAGMPAAADPAPEPDAAQPAWVIEAREGLTVPGKYLAFEDAGEQQVVPVQREWTRIGRSLAADVRFDDAAVSRRHALLVQAPDGVRIIDDRSLNGVWVNGERIEWRALADDDEIQVGGHVLRFLSVA
jgi:pSer/pThr/pTyr-binding forkhead associated (FHA) protein